MFFFRVESQMSCGAACVRTLQYIATHLESLVKKNESDMSGHLSVESRVGVSIVWCGHQGHCSEGGVFDGDTLKKMYSSIVASAIVFLCE